MDARIAGLVLAIACRALRVLTEGASGATATGAGAGAGVGRTGRGPVTRGTKMNDEVSKQCRQSGNNQVNEDFAAIDCEKIELGKRTSKNKNALNKGNKRGNKSKHNRPVVCSTPSRLNEAIS